MLAFGDSLHSVDNYDMDYWKRKKEEQDFEKIPGMTYEEWKKKVWNPLRSPQDNFFDSRMKVYGLGTGGYVINRYTVGGSVIVLPT